MMFFGGWMIIAWIIIVGLIVWAVVALTRRGAASPPAGERREALEIAKERYARGEISREDFEQIKKDLL